MDLEQGLSLGDLVGMVKRRIGVGIAVAGGTVLLAIFVSAVIPNKYESDATILVQPQTISQDLITSGVPQEDLNQRLNIIQMQIMSRGRLSRLIDDLHLYPDESKSMTREDVIDLMRDNIAVQPILPELTLEAQQRAGIRANSIEVDTFQIGFTYRNADMAAAVANRLANDFIDEHIKERVQLSGDTSEFIDSQLRALGQQMKDVDSQIAKVKGENAGQLPEDMAANQRLNERATDALREAQQELAIAESDEAFYRQQALTGAVTNLNVLNNNMTPAARLSVLQAQVDDLLSRGYTEKYPDIIAAREQIAQIQASLKAGHENADSPSSMAQENARAEMQRAKLRAEAAQKQIDEAKAQIKALNDRLSQTPRVAEQLASLQQAHDALAASYNDYTTKRQSADAAASMERRQKGEQFRVLEPAYPATSPSSPNRLLLLAVGLLLGAAFGGVAILGLEMVDSSFHNARRLQDELQIPVLASVPAVILASDVAARRRRRFVQGLAAVAITAAVLVTSFAGYRWVNGGTASGAPPAQASGSTPTGGAGAP